MSNKDNEDDPFKEMEKLLEEMMSQMGINEKDIHWRVNGPNSFGSMSHSNNPMNSEPNQPNSREERLIDVFEKENEIIVIFDTPGFQKEDINVELLDDQLVVTSNEESKKALQEEASIEGEVEDYNYEVNNGVLRVVLARK